jgi:hypothetical protein
VPSDAQGMHVVQVTYDAGPLGGKIVGVCTLNVSDK